MNGLFLEGGPLKVARDGDEYEISAPENAWTDDYNVIYLDQPVTTGFSYGNAPDNMAEGSENFRSFLKHFFGMYPEFDGREFYLTGESFAGKYHSLFTHDILEDNKKDGVPKINLKGTILFDPMPATGLQRIHQ